MGLYDFDHEIDRRGTMCEKYDNLDQVFGRSDIIPMWVADSDFATADFIMDAIAKRASHPLLGYSFRDERYSNAICSWVERRSGWKVDKEWIEFTPGVVCGLAFGVLAYSNEGDGVVIQPPVYPPFERTIKANNRTVLYNALQERDGRYEIDFEDFEEQLKKAKLFILCNPHNPTGRAFTKEELLRIGELCVKHKVMIVSDEIHSDLVFSPTKHIHIASLSKEIADITLTYIAPSKSFNIAGLSTAAALIPSPIAMERYRSAATKIHADQGNIFGAVALIAAYERGDRWLDEQIKYIEDNINFAVEFLSNNTPLIKAYKPEATYLLWLDCRSLALEGEALRAFFVDKAHLGLNFGADFGVEGQGFMRMNLATTRSKLVVALEQLKKAYDSCQY